MANFNIPRKIVCQRCKCDAVATNNNQRFCDPCKPKAAQEFKERRQEKLKLKRGEMVDAMNHFAIRSTRQVAAMMGISHETVRVTERRAIEKIRTFLTPFRT